MSAGDPSNFHELIIDPIVGPTSLQLDECFEKLDVPRDRRAAYEDVAQKLLQIGRDCDATMVEINPLVELPDGSLVALDARVAVDDAALARRPEIADMLGNLNPADGGPGGLRPSAEAGLLSLRRNPQGGAIGLIGLGGGLNMTLMDWIASAGSAVGAVIDIDPALAEGKAEAGFIGAFGDLDRDPSIRAILVNVITCGYRLDDIVYALARALRGRNPDAKPVVLHLRGNGMEATPKFLNAAGRRNSASLRHAVAEIVRAAGN
jgi:succinyl-CoA synthetase beta subunit